VTDPDSRIISMGPRGALQGYNAQATATVDQIVLAAEVHATTNDQPHFLPMVEATKANLVEAGHPGPIGTIVADAGYWTAANGTTDVDANVLIATKQSSWRKRPKPSDDRLAVLARVNSGELSQRAAGAILGVSYTWVRDMTKRYFGRDGQRLTTNGDPDPDEWIPLIERHARGELSQRAVMDQLQISQSRVKAMLAHVRGEATEPTIARHAMDSKLSDPENAERYKQRQHAIEPVFGNIKANLRYRRFAVRGIDAVTSEWRLICTSHNLLKLWRANT
jgi:transposase